MLSGNPQNGLAFTLPMKYTWHMCYQQPSNVVEMDDFGSRVPVYSVVPFQWVSVGFCKTGDKI